MVLFLRSIIPFYLGIALAATAVPLASAENVLATRQVTSTTAVQPTSNIICGFCDSGSCSESSTFPSSASEIVSEAAKSAAVAESEDTLFCALQEEPACIVYKFGAGYCRPCLQLKKPLADSLANLKNVIIEEFELDKLSAEEKERLVKDYNVSTIPRIYAWKRVVKQDGTTEWKLIYDQTGLKRDPQTLQFSATYTATDLAALLKKECQAAPGGVNPKEKSSPNEIIR